MKLYRHIVACAALVLSMAVVNVRAEEVVDTTSADHSEVQGKKKRVSRLEKLSGQLQLSAEQKEQVAALLQEEKVMLQAARKDTTLTPDVLKARKREIAQDYNAKIRDVLSAEQQAEFDRAFGKKKKKS
jgi:Spy/CpxP family protein refolding chaperone